MAPALLPGTASSISSSETIRFAPPPGRLGKKPPSRPSRRGNDGGEKLGIAAADLLSDEGWAADVADVDCVLHVANKDDMTVRVKEHCVCCARRMDLYFNEDPLFPA
jgi:hypothetical protein